MGVEIVPRSALHNKVLSAPRIVTHLALAAFRATLGESNVWTHSIYQDCAQAEAFVRAGAVR